MTAIYPAATVVLVRDGVSGLEVLLLRRSSSLAFGPGSWVFPGGRIDPQDYPDNCNDTQQAARFAAIREAKEEANIDLSEYQLLGFAYWVAPKMVTKRFATWFFISHIDTDTAVEVDGGEIDEYCWSTPTQALMDFNAKRIEIMPPAFVTLTELASCQNAAEAMQMYRCRELIAYFSPRWIKTEQGVCMLYEGDAGYDTQQPELPGARRRLWALKSGWRYECTL